MQTVSVLQRQFVQINSVLEISFVGRLFKYKQITVMHVCYLFECEAVCVLFCFRLSSHRKKTIHEKQCHIFLSQISKCFYLYGLMERINVCTMRTSAANLLKLKIERTIYRYTPCSENCADSCAKRNNEQRI